MTPKQFRRISEEVEKSFKRCNEFEVILNSTELVIINKSESKLIVVLYSFIALLVFPLILLLSLDWILRILGIISFAFSLFSIIRILSFDQVVRINFHEEQFEFSNKSIVKNLFKTKILPYSSFGDFKVKLISYRKWMMTASYGMYVVSNEGSKYALVSFRSHSISKRLKHLVRLALGI